MNPIDDQHTTTCSFVNSRFQFIITLSVVAVALSGCDRGQPARDAQDKTQQIGSAGDAKNPESPAADRVLLKDEQIASIRQAVERCGGTVRCDADGQPVAIDLAVERGSADAAALEAAVACPELKILRARTGQATTEELAKIQSLAKLEELMLHDAAVDDDFLVGIAARLRNLKRLTLRNTPHVTDRGIAAVSTLPHLTQLALIDLQISGQVLNALATSSSLALLDLRMCNNIQGSDLAALAQAPKLKELKLGGYGIDDDTIGFVSALPNLTSLTIEDASIGSDALKTLVENKPTAERIQILALARCSGINDESLRHLAALPNLRRLTLRDVPVTGTFLQSLPSPERLELLSLNQTYLADEAFDSIAACRNLKRLEVSGNYLTPAAIEQICTLSSLQYLNLSECGLNDEMLESLVTLPQLETLIVEGNPDVSAEALARIQQ